MQRPRRARAAGVSAGRDEFVIILAIENLEVGRLAEFTLRHGPYRVFTTNTVGDARNAMERLEPQLVVLDLDAADGRAVELITETDSDGHIPLIALTRRSDFRRQLEAFERGADDCIGVPFAPPDLVARVHSVLRRAYGYAPTAFRPIRLGDLEIDLVSRNVRTRGAEIHLTALQQTLLYLLASNAGAVVTRERILDAIWGDDFLGDSSIIERHVRSLRAKLQYDWLAPKYIETIAGAGYRFRTPMPS